MMKKLLIFTMLFQLLFISSGFKNSTDPAKWSMKKIDSWFEKREWVNGWNVKPDASISKRDFAIAYFRNKERWDKAFLFLKNNDLSKLDLKRFDIDGDNLYLTVSEYTTKNIEDARYEGHKKYIDIQYVVSGAEMIGLTSESHITKITNEYNENNDISFFTVGKIQESKATPDRFYIFFPSDIHRPGVKVNEKALVRKIVVKIRID